MHTSSLTSLSSHSLGHDGILNTGDDEDWEVERILQEDQVYRISTEQVVKERDVTDTRKRRRRHIYELGEELRVANLADCQFEEVRGVKLR